MIVYFEANLYKPCFDCLAGNGCLSDPPLLQPTKPASPPGTWTTALRDMRVMVTTRQQTKHWQLNTLGKLSEKKKRISYGSLP